MAQSRAWGMNFKAFIPIGDFNQNVTHTPAGLSLLYQRALNEESRFYWGVELGLAMYSMDRYDYELINEGYPGEFVRVEEEDCFWTLHLTGRYNLLETEAVQTYTEVSVGVTSFFSSRIALKPNRHFRDQFRTHGTAVNSGLGGGVLLNTAKIFSKEKEPGKLWLNLGAMVHSGSRTSYRNIEKDQGIYRLGEGEYRSLTHYTDVRFGMLFNLE